MPLRADGFRVDRAVGVRRLTDLARATAGGRLRQLAQAIGRLAGVRGRAPAPGTPVVLPLGDIARAALAARTARARHLPAIADALGEPVWDVMLALFVAHEDGHALTPAALYAAAAVVDDVGARYLALLEARGMARSFGNEGERQVGATIEGTEQMESYLATLWRMAVADPVTDGPRADA